MVPIADAADRIVLAVTALDLIRRVEGSPPPVEVVVTAPIAALTRRLGTGLASG